MNALMSLATDFASSWLTLHLFAMVLGLGGATYSDILLVKFLKDFKISQKEAEVIHTMSQVILIGIVLAFLSGAMLFLPKATELLQTPKFIAKNIAFAIIVINGFFLHRIVLPKLLDFSFHKEKYLIKKIIHLRHAGFIMGAISATSWYMVFFMGSFKNIPLSLTELLGIYFSVMLIGIGTALGIERKIKQNAK